MRNRLDDATKWEETFVPPGWHRQGVVLRHDKTGSIFCREPDGMWHLDCEWGSYEVGECPPQPKSKRQWKQYIDMRNEALENALDVLDYWERKTND